MMILVAVPLLLYVTLAILVVLANTNHLEIDSEGSKQ